MLGYHSWGGGGYPCTIRLDSGHLLTLYYGSSPRGGKSFPLCRGRALEPAVIHQLCSASQSIRGKATVKITDLKVFHMAGGHANWIFVKLYTDVGLTGVGESSMERHDPIVIRALESFKDFLIGKRPPPDRADLELPLQADLLVWSAHPTGRLERG